MVSAHGSPQPGPDRRRGYRGVRRRQGQAHLSTCVSGKCFWSALLPFGDEPPGARLKPELSTASLRRDRRNCRSRSEPDGQYHVTLNCFDGSAHVITSSELNFSCPYHPTGPARSGKTMFLASAYPAGILALAMKLRVCSDWQRKAATSTLRIRFE